MLTEEQRIEIQQEVAYRILEMLRSEMTKLPGLDDVLFRAGRHEGIQPGAGIESLGPLQGQSGMDEMELALMFTTVAHRVAQRALTSPSQARLEPLIRVVARAVEVLGTSEKALRWLNAPIRSLGDQTPASLLGSPEGIMSVEDALGRIEHGVW